MSRILFLTNLINYSEIYININPKYPFAPTDLLFPGVLRGIMVEKEEAAAERSWQSWCGVTGMLWEPKSLSLALDILETGSFPHSFTRDFGHLLLRAVKTAAFKESPGVAQSCISMTAPWLDASCLFPPAWSQISRFCGCLLGVVPAPPLHAKYLLCPLVSHLPEFLGLRLFFYSFIIPKLLFFFLVFS